MQIRRADLGDIEALLPQFEAYRAFYKCDAAPDTARAFLKENLETGRSIIFIAQDDSGKVVGFSQLYPRVSSLSMSPYIYISDLYVDKSARRHGIARKLMNVVKDFSIASGARNVQLETAHTNVNAQGLYESLGYEQDLDYRTYALSLKKTEHAAPSPAPVPVLVW